MTSAPRPTRRTITSAGGILQPTRRDAGGGSDPGRQGHHRRRQLLQVCWSAQPGRRAKEGLCPTFRLRLRPFEKTVIRGGYGLFYDSAENREIDGSADIYPYVSRGNYVQTITTTSLTTTDTLFPSFAGWTGDTCREQLHRGHLVGGRRSILTSSSGRCRCSAKSSGTRP